MDSDDGILKNGIIGFLNFVHHLIVWTEHRISETVSVSVLRWEVTCSLDLLETSDFSNWPNIFS